MRSYSYNLERENARLRALNMIVSIIALFAGLGLFLLGLLWLAA